MSKFYNQPPKHLEMRLQIFSKLAPETPSECDDWIRGLVEALEMDLMNDPYVDVLTDTPYNDGPTVTAHLTTSNITAHIWNGADPIQTQLTIYTCGDLDPDVVFQYLKPMGIISGHWDLTDREVAMKLLASGRLENMY